MLLYTTVNIILSSASVLKRDFSILLTMVTLCFLLIVLAIIYNNSGFLFLLQKGFNLYDNFLQSSLDTDVINIFILILTFSILALYYFGRIMQLRGFCFLFFQIMSVTLLLIFYIDLFQNINYHIDHLLTFWNSADNINTRSLIIFVGNQIFFIFILYVIAWDVISFYTLNSKFNVTLTLYKIVTSTYYIFVYILANANIIKQMKSYTKYVVLVLVAYFIYMCFIDAIEVDVISIETMKLIAIDNIKQLINFILDNISIKLFVLSYFSHITLYVCRYNCKKIKYNMSYFKNLFITLYKLKFIVFICFVLRCYLYSNLFESLNEKNIIIFIGLLLSLHIPSKILWCSCLYAINGTDLKKNVLNVTPLNIVLIILRLEVPHLSTSLINANTNESSTNYSLNFNDPSNTPFTIIPKQIVSKIEEEKDNLIATEKDSIEKHSIESRFRHITASQFLVGFDKDVNVLLTDEVNGIKYPVPFKRLSLVDGKVVNTLSLGKNGKEFLRVIFDNPGLKNSWKQDPWKTNLAYVRSQWGYLLNSRTMKGKKDHLLGSLLRLEKDETAVEYLSVKKNLNAPSPYINNSFVHFILCIDYMENAHHHIKDRIERNGLKLSVLRTPSILSAENREIFAKTLIEYRMENSFYRNRKENGDFKIDVLRIKMLKEFTKEIQETLLTELRQKKN